MTASTDFHQLGSPTQERMNPFGVESTAGEQKRINTAEAKLMQLQQLTEMAEQEDTDEEGPHGYSKRHYPDDDIHGAFRVAVASLIPSGWGTTPLSC